MDVPHLTNAERVFISHHLTDDVQTLLLRPPAGAAGLALRTVAEQIQARQKARHKLPSWYANPALTFPPPLSVEQASSEQTAAYKASLVAGHTLADLTGGMGVDTAAFARRVAQVAYVERAPDLAALTAQNLHTLGLTNVTAHTGDGLDWLARQPTPLDWVYLDPARRDRQGGRVVNLAHCEPNILTQLVPLLRQAHRVLLKTSPLLDIDATLRQLLTTQAVHVVAVQNEVKELLFVLGQTPTDPANVTMHTVNGRETDPLLTPFTYRRGDEALGPVVFSNPLTYLYEPHAALLKAGAFRLAGHRFGLAKLAPNSHLYTSAGWVPDFPGRAFRVMAVCRADRKSVAAAVPGGQANLTVRNFPQGVEALRRQLGLREGGSVYLFATTLRNGDKRLVVTEKVLP